MRAAALSEYSDISFVFVELRQHYNSLDKNLQREIDWLERAIKRICTSRRSPEKEIEALFPKLFSLRITALKWVAEEDEDINAMLDAMQPGIEKLSHAPHLRKLGLNIAQALTYNRKLVNFLKDNGQLGNKNIVAVTEMNYHSFVLALQLMPAQVRRIMEGLTKTSLFIEFFSIAAIMLSEQEVKATPHKIQQLTKLSDTIATEYIGSVMLLIALGQQEIFYEEHKAWMKLGVQNLSSVYSDDEPDISHLAIKEPNPEYNPD